MTDQTTKSDGTDLERAWLRGEPIKLGRNWPPTSVLSLRVPNEVLQHLTDRARAAGKPASILARELIEERLLATGPTTPAGLAQTFAKWVEETIDAESIEHGAPGPVSSFIASRLAHTGDAPPTVDELGLGTVRDHAFAWQDLRGRTQLFELNAVLNRPHQADWLHEIGGLFGIAGELILVALEAESEKAILRRHLEAAECRVAFTHWRSLRFFADGQIHYLVVAGHTLANLVLRTLALKSGFDPTTIHKTLTDDVFQPFSAHRDAWVSLNRPTARTFAKVARSFDSPGLQSLVGKLKGLVEDGAWSGLFAVRGSQHHRWRSESPGVSGVVHGESVLARVSRGEAVGLGPDMLPPYEGAEVVVAELCEVGRRALDSLGGFMAEFSDAWQAARDELANS